MAAEQECKRMNYTYILKCADDSLYCGWTNHIWKRLCAHNHGKGAKYTTGRGPVKLVYCEAFGTKEEAMQREAAIKKLSRKDKLLLIEAQPGHGQMEIIREKVHHLYWDLDLNCARTSLLSLSELCRYPLQDETIKAAAGMHGAGGFRAQCGLVEGTLMFLGIYGAAKGLEEETVVGLCRRFAEEFTEMFGSLRCYDLRPGGFSENDPPHSCEEITVQAILFAYRFVERSMGQEAGGALA